eukprot:EC723285.1.p2 GENE.EC723285.1~~EC723285.1.p2  ORF type:complete len:64 (+),score=1.61 EC723285.1:71-262(+)
MGTQTTPGCAKILPKQVVIREKERKIKLKRKAPLQFSLGVRMMFCLLSSVCLRVRVCWFDFSK